MEIHCGKGVRQTEGSRVKGLCQSLPVPPGWSLVKIICPIALQERSGIYVITQQGGK